MRGRARAQTQLGARRPLAGAERRDYAQCSRARCALVVIESSPSKNAPIYRLDIGSFASFRLCPRRCLCLCPLAYRAGWLPAGRERPICFFPRACRDSRALFSSARLFVATLKLVAEFVATGLAAVRAGRIVVVVVVVSFDWPANSACPTATAAAADFA